MQWRTPKTTDLRALRWSTTLQLHMKVNALAKQGWSVTGVVETKVVCVIDGRESKETIVLLERVVQNDSQYHPINVNQIGDDAALPKSS